MQFTVPMAIFDWIPVILYTISIIILQRDFYSRMTKGCYAIFCAGTIMVTVAGGFKAAYKLLYALGICDFPVLSECFMPFQATGFTLTAITVISYVLGLGKADKDEKVYSAAVPPLVTSKMLFVIFMVLGLVVTNVGFAILALRKKRTGAALLFILSLILEMGMGYLSTRDFTQASMNWIGEAVNFAGMVTMLLGTIDLHRNVFIEE